MLLLETVEDWTPPDWRIPYARAALLWTTCVVITAVALFNWLLLEYPGGFPEMFTLHAPCAHAVAVACGLSFVLILNSCQNSISMLMCKYRCRVRMVAPVDAVKAIVADTLMSLAVIAMATVRLCGFAPGLSAAYIMAPMGAIICGAFFDLIRSTVILCRAGLCDAVRCRAIRIEILHYLISGWTLISAVVMCVVLVILNVDGHICINWGFVAAPLIVVVPSAVAVMATVLVVWLKDN